MAGAGAPWYMPLGWPVTNVLDLIKRPSDEKAPLHSATADLDAIGHFTSIAATTRSFGMAYFAMYVVTNDYPAFGRAKTFELSWMWPIILRNVIATALIAGSWDWFLYFSPFKNKLRKYKLTQTYPPIDQLLHDAFWTFTASFCAAMIEIPLCYLWATGTITYIDPFSNTLATIYTLFFILTCTHWRIPHFYVIHRAMHPWHIDGIPDVGKFLYKHVHKLHHKSYNPTAFSGTSMHPVESTAYYTAALIAVVFGLHPVVFLQCIVDCAVGAWLGHDGFQWPGSGDYFHQLHHMHFNCNYGAMHVPIDKWMGTFAGCGEDIAKIWKSKGGKVTADIQENLKEE